MDFLSAAKYRYYDKDDSQNILPKVNKWAVNRRETAGKQMDDKERNMTEQAVKFLCKWAIENGQRQLTPVAIS